MFRILTEDKNREAIYAILDARIDGYTITPSIGAWKGQRENSLAIDLIGYTSYTAEIIAAEIKAANAQESVLVLDLTAQAKFI